MNQLLNDDQFWIQPACYALMCEMVKHKENLSKPFRMFTVLSTHDDPWISGCAARALGKTNEKKAVSHLTELIENRNNNFVLESSILALGDLKAHKATSIISEVLKKNDLEENIKEAAIRALINIKGENSLPYLLSFLENSISNEKDLSVKLMAIGAIARYNKDKNSMEILLGILKNPNFHSYCRLAAANEIINSNNKEAILGLEKFLRESDEPKLEERIKEMLKNSGN